MSTQLTEFERGRVIGISDVAFSFCNIAESLGPNVSNAHDHWKQWSRDSTASRRQGSGRQRGTIEREDHRIRDVAVAHRNKSAAEIRAAVGTTETQQTVKNRLFQGQL
ncbi:uncharacterized protein TNCV_4409271 [Trichonephila clavipes]|nr:uncharacterized protein TNCV_4409271 [Trichonephila clavipes]